MSLMCITNQMPDARSCTIRDQHQIICDGYRYRWLKWEGKWKASPCPGCLPREAQKGLLCWSCWERVEQAFADWSSEKARLMASIDRAVMRDNGGVRSGPEGYVPIPATKLAVDEIESYLLGSGDPERWVSATEGAMNAIRFARAVPAALRTHELEERAHKINRTRCTKCRQLTLVWNPPGAEGANVTVKCSACGAELPQASFEKVAAIENPDQDTAAAVLTEAGQAVNRSGFFAEDYNPTRPEHETLDPLTALRIAQLLPMAINAGVDEWEAKRLRKSELIDAIRSTEQKEPTA